ncbi:archaellin/type IV pilin N-terminal domain-containing protein [Methanoregula sp.]|uniref:archaellin/type IV pilin N-terminal domain-containing protein n=1 Tax=Methanoregula sp. TaxID=2052170 RepID=UPI003C757669
MKVIAMSSLKKDDNGFTGLEAAIVLIAFVVVAAVFSYVVLGAGFFTTQKAQQTVYSAVGQASSTVQIVGTVYGTNPAATGASTDNITDVIFNLGLAAGATPVDMSKVVMTFSDQSQMITLNATPLKSDGTNANRLTTPNWAITEFQNAPGANSTLLQPNEQMTIDVWLGKATDPTTIPRDDAFAIEIRPSVGAAFSITKTAPDAIHAVNILN